MSVSLSIRMLREHRWSFAGLTVVLVLASALVGVSLLVSRAASEGIPDRGDLTRNQLAILLGRMESGSVVADFMVFLSVFLAVVLVFQVASFMIDGRRKEIALLRLVGAGQRQVIALLVTEAFILSVGASLIGGIVALGTVNPFAQLLSLSSNWPPGLSVDVHPEELLLCLVLVPIGAVAGTLSAALRVVRVSLPDAMGVVDASSTRRIPVARLVMAGVGIAGMVVALLLPFEGGILIVLPAIVGGFAVLAASALAPLVVPIVSEPLGAALSAIAPGAGLVARKRMRFDTHRAGALATPIIVLLGLGSVFGMFAMTGRAYNAVGYQTVKNVEAVTEVSGERNGLGLYEEASDLPEVGTITRMQSTKQWSWADSRIPEDVSLSLEAVDPTTFSEFVPAQVLEGDLQRVGGDDVAVTTPTPFKVGTSFAIDAPDGARHQVRVVAVVDSSLVVNASILVDFRSFEISDSEAIQTWLVHAAPGIDQPRLLSALRAIDLAQVMTKEGWVAKQADRQVESLGLAVITIVAGGAIFAMVGLSLAILASSRERTRELEVLRAVGARARSVVASVMMESLIACVTALAMGGAIVLLVYFRMESALAQTGAGLAPVVPFNIIFGIAGISIVVAVLAAAIGAGLALRKLKIDARSC